MSGPSPATIVLSTRQRALLEPLRQRQTTPQRLVRRVLIVLALADNPCLLIAATDLGLNRISVRLWRDRWLAAAEALAQAEQDDLSDPQFLGLITGIRDDAPRPGGPATFSPEQRTRSPGGCSSRTT
jgi:putative transposase